jgi:hypothetical protein
VVLLAVVVVTATGVVIPPDIRTIIVVSVTRVATVIYDIVILFIVVEMMHELTLKHECNRKNSLEEKST